MVVQFSSWLVRFVQRGGCPGLVEELWCTDCAPNSKDYYMKCDCYFEGCLRGSLFTGAG